MMKTKEAIKFLKSSRMYVGYQDEKDLFKIIILLERGEKYEKIFNTILNWTMHDGDFIPVKELIKLEQKYFPKEK